MARRCTSSSPIAVLTRAVSGQVEHARMDLVFDQNGTTTYLDVAIVSPFPSSPVLIAAASTGPIHNAKRTEKVKFDRYPHVNLVPFIPETTGRPEYHTKKFISNLMKDADNCHLPSETPSQPSRASSTAPSPNNNSQLQPRNALNSLSLPSAPTVSLPCSSQVMDASAAHEGTPTALLPSAHQAQACTAHAGKQNSRHADLHSFHTGIFEAPWPPIVA